MNCKQGDLAIVVHCDYIPKFVGKIVRCISFKPDRNGTLPAWVIDPPLSGVEFNEAGILIDGGWILDRCLRPISSPGENEKDETLSWKPVPKEHAKG